MTILRIGALAVDLDTGEVQRDGTTKRLQEKSLQILRALAERPGELVTREELRQRLWMNDSVFVDFESGLNTAVNRLRQALGDAAGAPRFIETIPKRGYRLITPAAPREETVERKRSPRLAIPAASLIVFVVATAIFLFAGRVRRLQAGSASDRVLVAVLPFAADARASQLAESLTDEVITSLGQIAPRQLGVIARTSTRRYAATKKDVRTIGEELGVPFVLEGSVRGADNRISVSGRLIRAKDSSVVWSNSYQADRGELLSTQRLIASQVAHAVRRSITPRGRPAAVDAIAYERYLEGRYVASRNDPRRAAELFLESVRLAPRFAPAHAALAKSWLSLAREDRANVSRARESALRAAALDPSMAEPHHVLALIHLYYERDWASARRSFEEAVRLNDGIAEIHHAYAAFFSTLGEHDRAMAEIAKARVLDPVSVTLNSDACWYLYVARRFQDAIAQCRHALTLDPNHAGAHSYLLQSYLALGQHEKALSEANVLRGDSSPIRDLPSMWRWRIADLESKNRARQNVEGGLTVAYAAAGEREKALALLAQSLQDRSGWVIPFAKVHPAFDGLRDDPRFIAIVRQSGNPAHLN